MGYYLVMVVIDPSPAERAQSRLSPENLVAAIHAVKQDGFVVLQNVVDPEHVRIIREQVICRTRSEFVNAATHGVIEIVQDNIPAINPLDPEFDNMYIHNNIFFSQGYDNREQYDRYGGEAAAHVAVSKDIDGIQTLLELDMGTK